MDSVDWIKYLMGGALNIAFDIVFDIDLDLGPITRKSLCGVTLRDLVEQLALAELRSFCPRVVGGYLGIAPRGWYRDGYG